MLDELLNSQDINKRMYAMMSVAAQTGVYGHTKKLDRDTLVFYARDGKTYSKTLPAGTTITLGRYTVSALRKMWARIKETRAKANPHIQVGWEVIKEFVDNIAEAGAPSDRKLGAWMSNNKGKVTGKHTEEGEVYPITRYSCSVDSAGLGWDIQYVWDIVLDLEGKIINGYYLVVNNPESRVYVRDIYRHGKKV